MGGNEVGVYRRGVDEGDQVNGKVAHYPSSVG